MSNNQWVPSCDIKGGSQEMAAMMLMPVMNDISIITVISWLSPLIFQLLSP